MIFVSRLWRTRRMSNQECDPEVYQKGEVVFITHTIPSAKLEPWVRAIAKTSGQKVDWHYIGVRAVVRALGDLDRVRGAITKCIQEHDHLFDAELGKIGMSGCYDPPRPDWWDDR